MSEFEVEDFERDVIHASAEIPVLVDFWAEWCGPCKMLGPVIEAAAKSSDGRWKLVKIDTETHQAIAERFAISNIPNVKLFHQGEVIDEFAGFMSEEQLTRWLKTALPSASSALIAEARRYLDEGKASEAAEVLEPIVSAEPDNDLARLDLAEALFSESPSRVSELLNRFREDSEHFMRADALRDIAKLCEEPAESLPKEKGSSSYLEALASLPRRDYDTALTTVIASMTEGGKVSSVKAATLGKAIVKLLGVRHPTVERHYRRFSSLLHS